MAERSGPPPTPRGHDAYEAVSALQKAIRRSDPEAAAYWALELSGRHGHWLWKRLKTIAIEDCSPEATGLVGDVRALHEQWAASRGGDVLAVVRAAVALAIAPKSRVCNSLLLVLSEADYRREVPDEALDQHTLRGKRMGRGREHFAQEASRLVPWDGDLAEVEADLRERCRSKWPEGENR